jgi:hypothetical protein
VSERTRFCAAYLRDFRFARTRISDLRTLAQITTPLSSALGLR